MASAYVIDTNIISYALERAEPSSDRVRAAIRQRVLLYLCPVVLFEVRRGFLHRPNARKSEAFERLAHFMRWDELTRQDWERAAELWAVCEGSGRHADDADLLIAAYAISRGATVVTDNVRHLGGLGVDIENWQA